jgi:hypothetical protein
MRRSILLAIVAALALTIGMSTVASAGAGTGARATAKKKAAKCNTKKKAKKKAGKSALDGSAAKNRASKCKPKKKAKKKAATFGDGVYEDKAHGVTAEVSGKGTQVLIRITGSKCVGRALIVLRGPLTHKGSTAGASGTENVGGTGTVKWKLTVQDGLAYQLDTTWDITFPGSDPCHDVVTTKGTFKG